MQEKCLNLRRVNIISAFVTPAIFIACMIPYSVFTAENIKEDFTIWIFLALIIATLIGMVVHELIHAVFFALFTKNGFKSIKFGAYWKQGALYCHCNDPIKVKHYRITILMPAIILGFVPLVLSYIIQSFPLLFFACIMISAGLGDYFCTWLLRGMDKDTEVIDHPEKSGFLIPCDEVGLERKDNKWQ